MKFPTKRNFLRSSGFTIIELLISISIFVVITGLLLARYNSFDQSVFLTNLAHDVVLTVRTAQNYGLSVKSSGSSFDVGYGMHLETSAAVNGNNKAITLFAFPRGGSALFSLAISGSQVVQTIGHGLYVSALCAGTSSSCVSRTRLDISFKRPDLDAIICADGSCPLLPTPPFTYARITLSSSAGNIRNVIVQSSGQISIED